MRVSPAASAFSLLAFLLLGSGCASSRIQKPRAEPNALYEIAQMDKIMFDAFNAHDIEKLRGIFSEDLEFYHDTGGLISHSDAMAAFKSNFDRTTG
jgi:hypothetical protein